MSTTTRSSVLGLLKNFSGWTSSHCIPQIGAATNKCLQIFWIVFFLVCCAMFGYLGVYIVFTKYFSYPVIVSTELRFEERAFPAITLCNLNPYKKSEISNEPMLQSLMDEFSQALIDSSQISESDQWGFKDVDKYESLVGTAAQNLLFASSQLSVEKLLNMSYSLDELIMECSYEQLPCDMTRDWTKIFDSTYGACYQFNNQMPTLYLNTRNGPTQGLELLLRVDQTELLPTTEIAGVRITTHTADQHAFPEAFGYSAANGLAEVMRRMSYPYGTCTKTKEDISPFYYPGIYTTEACIRSCVQYFCVEEALVRDCGCGDPLNQLPEGAKYCNVTKRPCVRKFDLPQASVSNEMLQKANFTYDSCNCPQPCDENSYGVVMGAARWPTHVFTPKECFNETIWKSRSACITWYHENTVRVNIYYERMDFSLYEESPAYPMQSILYDLGGQFGLWLGFSSITIVEFFALGILIAMLVSAGHNGPELSSDVKKDMAYEKEEKEDNAIQKVLEDSSDSSSEDSSSSSSSEESTESNSSTSSSDSEDETK